MEQVRVVSPEFFRAMGLRLEQGRVFERKDVENGSDLIIVNQAFARRYLSGKDPLTSSILMNVLSPHPEKMPVIGVVSNAHDLGLGPRTSVLHRIDPNLSFSKVHPTRE